MTAELERPPSQTLSAVVLTFNEEHNIVRCLESLSWADEIVVVDSGSSDRTRELALAVGARFFEHVPPKPFLIADQRNWALDHADLSGNWVLFLDADEVATDALATEVRQCCQSSSPAAYQLAPKYMFWGRWMRRSMRYPAWHDRLLKRGAARYVGGVWEHFDVNGPVGRIETPYVHYGNSQGFSSWLDRHDRYSSWDAASIDEYLTSRDPASFKSALSLPARQRAARLWPTRPVARFLVMYLLRRGFLDGPEALAFCLRYAIYEYMTVEKLIELRRLRRGLPL